MSPVRIDGRIDVTTLDGIARSAARQEADGYRALWTSESSHDPFLPLVTVAQHTERVRLGCAIAVAFARSPMTLAGTVHDLQTYSGGRFMLGLGTQVRAHIERRFSMPWSAPLPRIEEFVAATRAILTAWEERTPLHFTGEHYRHTLMTPFFSPPPHGHGLPPIFLAAVGTGMARTAGRVADGVFTHSVATPRYLRERIVPAVLDGIASAGRQRADVEINCRGFVATGRDEKELAAAKEAVRARLAFYGSTPAYRPVFELHGWQDLATELHRLSRSDEPDRWTKMAERVDDEVLSAFAVVGEPATVARQIVQRYGDLADVYRYYTPYPADPAMLAGITRDLSETAARGGREDDRDQPQ